MKNAPVYLPSLTGWIYDDISSPPKGTSRTHSSSLLAANQSPRINGGEREADVIAFICGPCLRVHAAECTYSKDGHVEGPM